MRSQNDEDVKIAPMTHNEVHHASTPLPTAHDCRANAHPRFPLERHCGGRRESIP
jgi:hypothetical protein